MKKLKKQTKKKKGSVKKLRKQTKKKQMAGGAKKQTQKQKLVKGLMKQFKKKVLAIDTSIQEWPVKNYTAYRIKKGPTFLRIHKKKTNLSLPIKKIKAQERKKFRLKDNSSRAGHELATRGSRFSEKHLSASFIKLVRLAFKNAQGK